MKAIALLIGAAALVCAAEPTTELLWPNGAPGALGAEDADKPSITIYLADASKRNGTAAEHETRGIERRFPPMGMYR